MRLGNRQGLAGGGQQITVTGLDAGGQVRRWCQPRAVGCCAQPAESGGNAERAALGVAGAPELGGLVGQGLTVALAPGTG